MLGELSFGRHLHCVRQVRFARHLACGCHWSLAPKTVRQLASPPLVSGHWLRNYSHYVIRYWLLDFGIQF
jgi:hypothetical protein